MGTQVFATTGRIFGTDTATTTDDENWTRVLVNATAPQTSSSTLPGTYGTLSIDQNGAWTYQLGAGGAGIAAAVQSLRQGQIVEDLFTLRVSDGALASTQTARVQVTGVNDAPTDIALIGNTVAEGAALGAVLSILTSTDPDSGDAAAFTLLDNAGGRFGIANGNQLVVANGGLLDFETATSHLVTVRVTDSFGDFRDESFTISVSNVDESAPVPFVGGDEPNDFLGTTGPDGMLGGGGNDTLRGGEGNDVLDGGIGDDSMIGGNGPDVYFVNSVNDVVEEGPAPGVYDTIWTTVSYTLPENVEIFIARGSAGDINGTGNDDVTLMLGNEGNNRLSSLGGIDIVLGQSGNDTIEGGSGFLDLLFGGNGADVLTGGPGHDFFAFQFVQEAGDVITDFNTTSGSDLDILDLRPLWETFTNFGEIFTVSDAVSIGHFRFVQSGANTQVFADRDTVTGSEAEVLLVTILNTNASAVQGLTLIV